MATPPVSIGWIGLGQMGQAHVQNLLKGGNTVVVWNRTEAASADAVAAGAKQAKSSKEVVEVRT